MDGYCAAILRSDTLLKASSNVYQYNFIGTYVLISMVLVNKLQFLRGGMQHQDLLAQLVEGLSGHLEDLANSAGRIHVAGNIGLI